EERAGRHPGPNDLALVIEVSDTTLARDREWKGPMYARAGIRVYWIVNLNDRVVEVYTEPSGPVALPSYRQRKDYSANETVSLALPQATIIIPVNDLLP